MIKVQRGAYMFCEIYVKRCMMLLLWWVTAFMTAECA